MKLSELKDYTVVSEGVKLSELKEYTIVKPETYGATFPATGQESPLQAGLKTAGNIPSSGYNLVKNVGSALASPIQTLKGIGKTAMGGVQKLIPGQQADEEYFNAFTNSLKERYGSLDNLQKTAVNDPVGFATELLGVVGGGASVAGKSAQFNKAVSTVGKGAIKPVTAVTGGIANKTRQATKFTIGQATGLSPETITELVRNPQAFKNVTPEIRRETANVVKEALDTRLSELADTGKGYETIRQSSVAIPIPDRSVQNILDKYGVKVVNGKVKTTAESIPLSSGDKASLESFLETYGNEPILSPNGLLNARSALSELSKYSADKTGNLQKVSRDLRGLYDTVAKRTIPELAQLDFKYAPERQLLSQIKKDILLPNGELKDQAISKIANATGKGKEQFLERVKEIIPDIEQRVKVLRAVEDIENANGIKVGTYSRSITQGGGLVGIATGNVPAIVAAILAQPEIAVPLLKGYGYVGKKALPILRAVKEAANDVNNFTLPAPLLNERGKLKMGASIEDISKTANITGMVDLIKEARKYKSAEEFVGSFGRGKGGIGAGVEYTPNKRILIEQDQTSLADILGEDKTVMVYRGVDRATQKDIVQGDYVATSKELASSYTGQGKILSKNVNLKDIIVDKSDGLTADDIKQWLNGKEFHVEANYVPNGVTKSQLTDIWNKANNKSTP